MGGHPSPAELWEGEPHPDAIFGSILQNIACPGPAKALLVEKRGGLGAKRRKIFVLPFPILFSPKEALVDLHAR